MTISSSNFEALLSDLHKEKYDFISDFIENERRVVRLKKYTIQVTLILTHIISFDAYAELSGGIYELGDLHSLTRRMLNLKKLCLSYEAREMNTTERLYPADRRGQNTTTSGL